jgi:hypothetical protein
MSDDKIHVYKGRPVDAASDAEREAIIADIRKRMGWARPPWVREARARAQQEQVERAGKAFSQIPTIDHATRASGEREEVDAGQTPPPPELDYCGMCGAPSHPGVECWELNEKKSERSPGEEG